MTQSLKKNNKCFSLIGLLVVVAILGILAVVLVPQYIQYLDSSRESVDKAQAEEIGHAAEVAIAANEALYSAVITAGGASITVKDNTAITTAPTNILGELTPIVGTSIDFKSKKYDGKTVTIAFDANGKLTSVSQPA